MLKQAFAGLSPKTWILFAAFALMAGCGPKYPKCETDDHCQDKGEVCVESLCQQCRDDSQCKDTEACQGGRCEVRSECISDSDCSGNLACRLGKCQIECQADTDCASGLRCENQRCIDAFACDTTDDCTSGMTCIAGRCSDNINANRGLPCSYPTVRFSFNQARLSSGAQSGLANVAECIKSKDGSVVIEGHCDERGTEEYNLALGDRRARAVRDYLIRLGIPSSKLQVVSKGELQPNDSGHDEAAWAANRRAEFIEQ